MDINGVPPLSLRWSRSVNGRKQTFLVEGIEGSHSEKHPQPYDDDISSKVNIHGKRTRAVAAPEQLRVPLTVSLDSPGAHVYTLEEVMDAVGNVVIVPSDARIERDTKAVQSFRVLQRPAMSFKYCSPGNPTPLLIGQQAQLAVAANEADPLDAPWSVELKYRPPVDNEKKLKPWKKTVSSEGSKRELTIAANAPGEYTLASVRGKYCNGDILAPESCVVVESSGDTGVSASLVLHGTPPFHVYYREQKDSEPARELAKVFGTSRGEFTIQPEHSGHYTFTFTQISDANYKKVELKGPTIDQIIHPPASAEFANMDNYTGRKKKEISSCEGNLIDVDVDLRGSGPWNLELQVVGPKSSETIKVSDINSPRKTLQIPIPSHINQEGGSFDIDLVSVEDKYGCKRSLSVPGISRKGPTA
ncbi:hypothetical protein MPER_10724 [Moniliophthora perniciosa FA553]|nr:hypothetical protein MPER_10724 [Moniliophthora perniciosa FA553]